MKIDHSRGPTLWSRSNGMLTGGRVLPTCARDRRHQAVIPVVGYQGEGTLGARLQAGITTARLDGQEYTVRCGPVDQRVLGQRRRAAAAVLLGNFISGARRAIGRAAARLHRPWRSRRPGGYPSPRFPASRVCHHGSPGTSGSSSTEALVSAAPRVHRSGRSTRTSVPSLLGCSGELGSSIVASRGVAHDVADLPCLVAVDGERGLAWRSTDSTATSASSSCSSLREGPGRWYARYSRAIVEVPPVELRRLWLMTN